MYLNIRKSIILAYAFVFSSCIGICSCAPTTFENKVDIKCQNCSIDNQREVHQTCKYDDLVSFTVKADEGYNLPDNIVAKIGDIKLIKDADYTYSKETGEIKFIVKGDTTISVNAIAKEYRLNVICSNISVNEESELHKDYRFNEEVKLTFKADDHYSLPDDVTAKIGDKKLVRGVDYTYSKETGEMKYVVKGETNILISAKINEHRINVICDKATVNGESELHVNYSFGHEATFTFTSSYQCHLPDDLTVKIGDKQLVKGTDYTYSKENGEMKYIVKGDTDISITALINEYAIDVVCFDASVNGVSNFHQTYAYNSEATLLFKTINDHFSLPIDVVAKVGDKRLMKGVDYTYSQETGEMKYIVKDDTRITITAVANEYTLNITCENATIDGKKEISKKYKYNTPINLKIIPNDHFSLLAEIIVKVGDKTLINGVDYTYYSDTGDFNYLIVGDTNVQVFATDIQYKFNVICDGATVNGGDELYGVGKYKQAFTLKFKANEHFTLPDDVYATTGGKRLVKNIDYTYLANDDGTYDMNFMLEGDTRIAISAIGDKCELNVTCNNSKVYGETEYHNEYSYNSKVTLTFTADDHYSLPVDVVAKIGDRQLAKDIDYIYSSSTGKMEFNMQGNTNISISAIIAKYSVNVSCYDCTVNGSSSEIQLDFDYGSPAYFSFKSNTGYHMPSDIHVYDSIAGRPLRNGADYNYSISPTNTHEAVLTLNVKSSLSITASGNIVMLNSTSWDEIKEISQAGIANKIFRIGDTKDIIVNGITQKVRIIGFNQDVDKNGNKIGITFEFANLLSDNQGFSLACYWDNVTDPEIANLDYMNSTIRAVLNGAGAKAKTDFINYFQYFGTDPFLDQTLNSHYSHDFKGRTVLSMLPSDLQSVLTAPRKYICVYAARGFNEITVNDKLFLLSPKEMGYDNFFQEPSTFTYDYYRNHTQQVDTIRLKHQIDIYGSFRRTQLIRDDIQGDCPGIKNVFAGTSFYFNHLDGSCYWLRSPIHYGNGFAWSVDPMGRLADQHSGLCACQNALGLSPCFCV